MPKLIGIRKINIAVFISGTGSNLKNLINYSFKKNSKFKIALVISNNIKAKGLNHSMKLKKCSKIMVFKLLKKRRFK
tara:strand:- start:6 stop:236 length:231 start_codon:yes stop_codon:yes gene_type:complete